MLRQVADLFEGFVSNLDSYNKIHRWAVTASHVFYLLKVDHTIEGVLSDLYALRAGYRSFNRRKAKFDSDREDQQDRLHSSFWYHGIYDQESKIIQRASDILADMLQEIGWELSVDDIYNEADNLRNIMRSGVYGNWRTLKEADDV